ncbi:methyltransferase [Candidatus Woesearchaeota archaeon]|nr:methyltransferase [Candidatus Woesearchaeota archaeon]MCF7901448.1 methyltransferase [Candidatus Woesearchaeota archaeon]MCF8013533.1 methyltransferase [Candidatus Woesearchaeota archaeon]
MYEPAEDSYLLKETIQEHFKQRAELCEQNTQFSTLDMGTGSGILANQLAELCEQVIAVEINQETINEIKNKLNKKIKLIQSNLFEKIPKQKFDLITFNPPYLPKGDYPEDEELTSGKTGLNTTIEFLKQAKEYLTKNGTILFIASSLAKLDLLEKTMKELKYEFKQIKKKHISFEDIIVYEAKINH